MSQASPAMDASYPSAIDALYPGQQHLSGAYARSSAKASRAARRSGDAPPSKHTLARSMGTCSPACCCFVLNQDCESESRDRNADQTFPGRKIKCIMFLLLVVHEMCDCGFTSYQRTHVRNM